MTRFEFLKTLIDKNDFKWIAEIGVFKGETSRFLTENCALEEYWMIDNMKTPFPIIPNTEFVNADSETAAKTFGDRFFDLVFIDADHKEEAVYKDITAWLPKIRVGGIICGHDYDNPEHPGVRKAVDRFFEKSRINFVHDCYVWWVQL